MLKWMGATAVGVFVMLATGCPLINPVNFIAGPVEGYAPLEVAFTDTSVFSGSGPLSFTWDFGDGATSIEQHPTHTYESPGIYTVSLTVFDGCLLYTNTKVDFIIANHPLELKWSTYLGGDEDDETWDCRVNADGDFFVAGHTRSADLPVTDGAFDTTYWQSDAYIAKFDGETGDLIYCTYLGGHTTDEIHGLLPLPNGEVAVCGFTQSPGFPVTQGAFSTTLDGESQTAHQGDLFVTVLNATGSELVYSTFIGGRGHDNAWERNTMAVDAEGCIYVTGYTGSNNFPVTPGAIKSVADSLEAFVVKLSADGSALEYSTLLGGTSLERGKAVAVDTEGNAYVTGWTTSSDFPTTPGAYDTTYAGAEDAFVVKLNSTGTGLIYSTFIGGTVKDYGWDIVVDPNGEAIIAGKSDGPDYPTTPGAFQEVSMGSSETTVSRLSADGSALIASTYFGGTGGEIALGLTRGHDGTIWFAGNTSSLDMPVTPNALHANYLGGGGDACVAALSPDLSTLIYSSYLGSSGTELESRVGVDAEGNLYIAGNTDGTDFATTSGAVQPTQPGETSNFVMKIGRDPLTK